MNVGKNAYFLANSLSRCAYKAQRYQDDCYDDYFCLSHREFSIICWGKGNAFF